jgi:hypothetical protein
MSGTVVGDSVQRAERKMRKTATSVFLCAVCLGLGARVGLGAETESVVVNGESTVSYDDATQRAIRAAIRQVAGVALTSETKVKDYELIREAIYSRAAGYCRSYDVLEKNRGLDDTYVVRVRADVARGQIKDDFLAIQSLIEQMGRPRFITLVEPRAGAVDGTKVWVEAAINDHFEQTGFSVLHAETRDEAQLRAVLRAVAQGDTAKARQLKLRMGAPYGIDVVAFTQKKKERVYNVDANFAVCELRVMVVHRDSGEIVASKTGVAKAGSIDTSGMRSAAKKVVADVFPQVLDRILYHWCKDLDVGTAFTVEIAHAPFEVVSGVQQALEGVDGVRSVRGEGAPDGGIAVLRVIGRVSPHALADRIGEWGEGRLRVGYEGRTVTATYVAGDRSPGTVPPNTEPSPTDAVPGQPQPDYILPAAIVGGALLLAIVVAAVILKKR